MTKRTSLKQLATSVVKAVDPNFRIIWYRRPLDSFTWDGSGVLRMSERTTLLAVHDAAHVACCSKKRLKQPEFGLGPDPAGHYDNEPERTVSSAFAQKEEERACDLHWAMVAYSRGLRAAYEVEDYLNMRPPTRRTISKMRRYGGLPPDFVDVVLQIQKDRKAFDVDD
jgi:hypothetical protein